MSRSTIVRLSVIFATSAVVSNIHTAKVAQAQAQETKITIPDFFVKDRDELKPGAREKLKQAIDLARKCPSDLTVMAIGTTIMTGGGEATNWLRNQLRDYDVNDSRYNVLTRIVREFAGDWDFKVVPPRGVVTGRWERVPNSSYQLYFVPNGEADVDVVWTLKPDQEKPKLEVVWTPPNGSKVKAGDKITAKLTARDDATEAETGVARLRVDIGVGGGTVGAPAIFPPPMPLQECGRQNPVRTFETTYTVPPNPPPVVQLRGYARDFAGNETWSDAQFPTGEVWKGTINLVRDGRNPQCSAITSTAEYTVVVASDGTVTGSGTFDHGAYTCPPNFTAPPTQGTIKLGGKKEGGRLTVFINDWEPKNALIPRLPGGQQVVQVGQSRIGEATFSPGEPEVQFRVKLECQNCDPP
jgi:hypothetical protein